MFPWCVDCPGGLIGRETPPCDEEFKRSPSDFLGILAGISLFRLLPPIRSWFDDSIYFDLAFF